MGIYRVCKINYREPVGANFHRGEKVS